MKMKSKMMQKSFKAVLVLVSLMTFLLVPVNVIAAIVLFFTEKYVSALIIFNFAVWGVQIIGIVTNVINSRENTATLLKLRNITPIITPLNKSETGTGKPN